MFKKYSVLFKIEALYFIALFAVPLTSLWASKLSLSGFANFGATYADIAKLSDSKVGEVSPSLQGQFRDGLNILNRTQVGFNLAFAVSNELEFRAQLVSNGGNISISPVNVDWAYLVRHIGESSRLIIGRQLAPIWKDSQYFDVEAATILRNNRDVSAIIQIKSFDGISINNSMDVGEEGILNLSAGIGSSWVKYEDVGYNILRSILPTLQRQDRGGANQIHVAYVSSRYEWESLIWHTYASLQLFTSNLFGYSDTPTVQFTTALAWEGDSLYFEAEGGYAYQAEDEDETEKRAAEQLTILAQLPANDPNRANRLRQAQYAYLNQEIYAFQVLAGYRISDAILPYIGYSQQNLLNDKPVTKIRGIPTGGIPFIKNLFGHDVQSFIAGLNVNVSPVIITKFNYYHKQFGNPQYKDGALNPDYSKNSLLDIGQYFVPRDKDAHIYSFTIGTTF